jgi:hypothetical protein
MSRPVRHEVVLSDKPATGPEQPFSSETFAKEPELRSPPKLTPEEKAARHAEVLKQNAEIQRKADEAAAASAALKAEIDKRDEDERAARQTRKVAALAENGRRARLMGVPLPAGFQSNVYDMILAEWPNLISRDAKKRRKELVGIREKIRVGIANTTDEAVKKFYAEQCKKQAEAAASGNTDDPPHFYSKDELRQEALTRRKILKEKLREIEGEMDQIDIAALAKLAPRVDELYKRVVDSEKVECEKFGFPFSPSALAQSLEGLAVRMTEPSCMLYRDQIIGNVILKG